LSIVAGCTEFKRPDNAWYKREGNEAVIGCDNNDKEWHLTCIDNKWIGDVGNCSQLSKEIVFEIDKTYAYEYNSLLLIMKFVIYFKAYILLQINIYRYFRT